MESSTKQSYMKCLVDVFTASARVYASIEKVVQGVRRSFIGCVGFWEVLVVIVVVAVVVGVVVVVVVVGVVVTVVAVVVVVGVLVVFVVVLVGFREF